MVATINEIAATDSITRAHATGAALRRTLHQAFADTGTAGHLQLTGYDCFLNIDATGNTSLDARQLKTLFLDLMIRSGTLVRGIFYPTAAHTGQHLESTAHAARRAAAECARALDGRTSRLPAALHRPL